MISVCEAAEHPIFLIYNNKIIGQIHNLQLMTSHEYDKYMRNFRIFYNNLLRSHPQEELLNKKFKNLLEFESKKWRLGGSLNKKNSDLNNTLSENSFLSKVKSMRTVKEAKTPRLRIDHVYTSKKIQSCIVFGYLYSILEQGNIQIFQMISQELGRLITKENFTEVVIRKFNYSWVRLLQLFTQKKKREKVIKQLQEGFKEFNEQILEILYEILHKSQGQDQLEDEANLTKMSQNLKINVIYFEANEFLIKQMKKILFQEETNFTIAIGHLQNQQLYTFVLKIPEREEMQISAEKIIEKFSVIANNLEKQYHANTIFILKLDHLNRKDLELQSSIKKVTRKQNNSTVNYEFREI